MTSLWLDVVIVAYLGAFLSYMLWHATKGRGTFSFLGGAGLIVGALATVVFMAARWAQSGAPPFTTLPDTMLLFALGVGLFYMGLSLFHDLRGLGAVVACAMLLAVAYTTTQAKIEPRLVPALQNSFWLTIHVVFSLLGYASLAVSFMAALASLAGNRGRTSDVALYIIGVTVAALVCTTALVVFTRSGAIALRLTIPDPARHGAPKRALFDIAVVLAGVFTLAGIFWFLLAAADARWDLAGRLAAGRETFSSIVERAMAIGFTLLGLGILTGAVWANIAWGRYWGWDPKETSSLVTWLVYFVCLHLRYVKGWRDARMQWVSVFGFACVLFTWFGVNYFLGGLHAYH
jgi:cytochrome c-type biogenesis protein CcsB